MDTQSSGSLRAVPVKQMVSLPPYKGIFTEPAIRALIFNAEPSFDSRGKVIQGNGLLEAGAIIRLGRRVLIDLDRFDSWIGSGRATAPASALPSPSGASDGPPIPHPRPKTQYQRKEAK